MFVHVHHSDITSEKHCRLVALETPPFYWIQKINTCINVSIFYSDFIQRISVGLPLLPQYSSADMWKNVNRRDIFFLLVVSSNEKRKAKRCCVASDIKRHDLNDLLHPFSSCIVFRGVKKVTTHTEKFPFSIQPFDDDTPFKNQSPCHHVRGVFSGEEKQLSHTKKTKKDMPRDIGTWSSVDSWKVNTNIYSLALKYPKERERKDFFFFSYYYRPLPVQKYIYEMAKDKNVHIITWATR